MNVSVTQEKGRLAIGVDDAAEAIRAGFKGWGPAVRATWGALVLYALAAGVAARYGGSPFTAPTATIVHVATASLAYGSLYRRAFGRELGPFGLQIGAVEARVLASSALIGLVLTFAAALAFVVIGAVALGVAMVVAPSGFNAGVEADWRAAFSGPQGIVVLLPPLLSAAGLVWLALRLSLGPAASVSEDQIRALAAFPYTRGAALGLFLLAVALGLPMVLASLAAATLGASQARHTGSLRRRSAQHSPSTPRPSGPAPSCMSINACGPARPPPEPAR